MKSNVFKKVLSIVIISLVLAITITTVVLALIPKKLYNPIADSYRYITIYQKDNDTYNLYDTNGTDEQKQVCSAIAENMKKSLKDNVLSSIFQGTGKYDESIVVSKVSSVESSIAKGKTCLIFGWLEKQKLTIKGEEYTPSNSNDVVTYTQLVMPVENDNDFQERIVYVLNSDGSSTYQIKFLAHQSDLYSYINGLSW